MEGFSVGDYYAPLYWGFVVATVLLGTTYVQTYIYLSRNKDTVLFQALVITVVVLDTIDTVLMTMVIFHYFLQNFGNYSAFAQVVESWWLEAGVTVIITSTVQIFFASRIYLIMRQYPVLTKCRRLIPLLIVIVAIAGLGAGLAKMALIHILSESSGDYASVLLVVATCAEESFGALSDIITTVTLCYILASAPSAVKKTRSRIQRVWLFVLTRGVLVTVIQIVTLVSYAVAPLQLYSLPGHLCKSKLYTNTLLAMLNARGSTEAEFRLTDIVQESEGEIKFASNQIPLHERSF